MTGIDRIIVGESYEQSRLRNPEADVNAEIEVPDIPTVIREIDDEQIVLVEAINGVPMEDTPYLLSDVSITDPDNPAGGD